MVIRAVMLTPNLSLGGAERWIATLIKCSDPARVRWTGVAVSGWGGTDPELCYELAQHVPIFGAEVVAYTRKHRKPTPAGMSKQSPLVYREGNLADALARAAWKADVIVAWGGNDFRSTLSQLPRPLPFVLVSHSSHHTPRALGPEQGITHLVAVSRAAAKPFTYPGNAPITVIHNGVDVERLRPRVSRGQIRISWEPARGNRIMIGYIGRQTAEKNPRAALRALEHLPDSWGAVYYGERPPGQERLADPEWQARAAEQFGSRVRFFPPTQDIGSVYGGIDVLMLASETEAFSLTLLEAWLSRVPVVATRVGSVVELEEQYGPLVTPVPQDASGEALARACEAAVSEEGLETVERAAKLAAEQFTGSRMAARWVSYLEEVVYGSPPLLDL